MNEELLKKLIAERFDLPSEAIQLDMLDYFKIIALGARKYKMNNWLDRDGKRCREKEMHDSMFHHLAESFSHAQNSIERFNSINHCLIVDKESGLDPLLHLMCRAGMLYTRRKRSIQHPSDTI